MEHTMELTTQNLLDTLTATTLHSADVDKATLTNAQKAFQLTIWTRESLTKSRLNDFFSMVESTINALPAGNTNVKTFNSVTGETLTKEVKYRDIAKRAIVTAWKNATKPDDFSEYHASTLKFKMSLPGLVDKPLEKTLAEKLELLIGATMSARNLDVIVDMIAEYQTDQKVEIKELADLHSHREEIAIVQADYAKLTSMGISSEDASIQTGKIHGLNYDEVDAIVNS